MYSTWSVDQEELQSVHKGSDGMGGDWYEWLMWWAIWFKGVCSFFRKGRIWIMESMQILLLVELKNWAVSFYLPDVRAPWKMDWKRSFHTVFQEASAAEVFYIFSLKFMEIGEHAGHDIKAWSLQYIWGAAWRLDWLVCGHYSRGL